MKWSAPMLLRIDEPPLLFKHQQAVEDPRDGLTLFGPLDAGKPHGIRAGVIGTADGRRRFRRWVQRAQSVISNDPPRIARPCFPGFQAAFQIPWNAEPAIELNVDPAEINRKVHIDDPHQRVYQTVDLFANAIIEAIRTEDIKPEMWFVIIPDEIHKCCRPRSVVARALQVKAGERMNVRSAQRLSVEPFLLPGEANAAVPYQYEVNFHNQLKGRLLEHNAPTQIIRESTIAHREILNRAGYPTRRLDEMESAIAWNLCSTAFYKCGGRPWKINSIREGVCYIGLVFKQEFNTNDPRSACCAAQMFLDSGDGVVFKGNVGPWYSPERGDYHLSADAARELVEQAMKAYRHKHNNKSPSELFIHGKVRFDQREWTGFREAAGTSTNLVGVRIRSDGDLKLFRRGDQPVLRGLAYVRDAHTAYLWTKGFTPRLRTYPGREVPLPLLVDVCKGDADIKVVLNDLMALTKLNYNACIFADGQPVTLRFADAIGEILTSGPFKDVPPLPFKLYI
jgi:hypothetical protein